MKAHFNVQVGMLFDIVLLWLYIRIDSTYTSYRTDSYINQHIDLLIIN